jgi:ABC-type lipoprotein release transport system permease subunit
MMALGTKRASILLMFVIEALTIGATGAVSGAAAGVAVVLYLGQRGIAFHFPSGQVPFILNPFTTPAYLAQVCLMATVGAGVFSLYPALRASRMRPVEALAGK